MTTPKSLRDNGSRLMATTATSTLLDPVGTVALSLTTPTSLPDLARPARTAQRATR